MSEDRKDMSEGSFDIGEVEAVDLTDLDPTHDARQFDDRVAGVVAAAQLELARRASADPRHGGIPTSWRRIAWPAAAGIALASVVGHPADRGTSLTIDEEMAVAAGVPTALAGWIEETDSPLLGEILVGWEEE